jgi:hypothetical protein
VTAESAGCSALAVRVYGSRRSAARDKRWTSTRVSGRAMANSNHVSADGGMVDSERFVFVGYKPERVGEPTEINEVERIEFAHADASELAIQK